MENINRKINASIKDTSLNGFKRIGILPTNTTNTTFNVKYYVVENTKIQLEFIVIIRNTIQFYMYDGEYKKQLIN
jgi:hypothetical protein